MYDFEYVRPATVQDAGALLKETEDAMVIAGGASLVPVLKHRLANPTLLVDVSGIEGLADVAMEGHCLSIGAMARHFDVANSPIVKRWVPALAALASQIADPAIRNVGTIGGSLANNDPTADYPAACSALDAVIVTNKRRLKSEQFFQGLFTTCLDHDEIIVRVLFPQVERCAYKKFRSRASHYAMVGVFVAKHDSDVRVAVTGAGSDGVFRVTEFERSLEDNFSPEAIRGIEVATESLTSDRNGSAVYRAELINVMSTRAIRAANAQQ